MDLALGFENDQMHIETLLLFFCTFKLYLIPGILFVPSQMRKTNNTFAVANVQKLKISKSTLLKTYYNKIITIKQSFAIATHKTSIRTKQSNTFKAIAKKNKKIKHIDILQIIYIYMVALDIHNADSIDCCNLFAIA